LQEVASRLLRFKAAQIQYKGYQRSFEMWGDMVQQFLDRKLAIEIAGIEGSEESLSRQQERGEAIALLNAFAPMVASLPGLNMKPVLERVALAYNFPNPEALFVQPPTPAAAAPGDGFNPNILGPRIGAVPQRNQNMQQGGLQLDPRLSGALGQIGSGATTG
jgi:hypothetical protein